jgi:hypothetical protein
LNGAIGMTYETDGGGFKGLNWTRDDGTIVTFRSAIRQTLRRFDDDAGDGGEKTAFALAGFLRFPAHGD